MENFKQFSKIVNKINSSLELIEYIDSYEFYNISMDRRTLHLQGNYERYVAKELRKFCADEKPYVCEVTGFVRSSFVLDGVTVDITLT